MLQPPERLLFGAQSPSSQTPLFLLGLFIIPIGGRLLSLQVTMPEPEPVLLTPVLARLPSPNTLTKPSPINLSRVASRVGGGFQIMCKVKIRRHVVKITLEKSLRTLKVDHKVQNARFVL